MTTATLTLDNVLASAGLDWRADKVGLYTDSMDVVSTHRAIRRSDTGAILGVVGEGYEPVQNASMLDYLRDLTAHAPDLEVFKAGNIDGGRRVFIEARVPSLAIVLGDDITHFHFTLINGHAGNGAMSARGVYFRKTCTNRLAAQDRRAYEDRKGQLSLGVSFRHTRFVADRMTDVSHAFRRSLVEHEATLMAYKSLAAARSTPETLAAIILAAWPISKDDNGGEGERARTIRLDRTARIESIRRSPTCNVIGTAGSIFADLNAVTEYVDHHAMKDADKRFASAHFGGALEDAKARAYGAALALV
jgi:phage/plasmid-like protein (TIGR03299 family)